MMLGFALPKKAFAYTFIAFLFLAVPLALQAQESLPVSPTIETVSRSDQPVEATLLSEVSSVQPGKSFWVAVKLDMKKGWDTYWINPGDAGIPTQVEWSLPNGFQAGEIVWPVPQKFESSSMVGFGYTDSVMLLTKITPPKTFTGDEVKLQAHVRWLACNEMCQPGDADVHLILPKGDGAIDTVSQSDFAKARTSLPKELTKEEGKVSVKKETDNVVLHFKPEGKAATDKIEQVQFFPEEQNVFDLSSQSVHVDRGGVTVNLKKGVEELPGQVKGLLVIQEKGNPDKIILQVNSAMGAFASSQLGGEIEGYLGALVLAFLGGIILNVMPCVLPVIALKIFSFVKMGQENRRKIFQHGMVFTLGVLVSFWILSGVLLLLRAYGASVGWGFQLQEPGFVAVMIGLLFLLGLSLLGVFELGASMTSMGEGAKKSSSPYLSSFMSGVLATLVATPCTGPLLGPALGFALTLPTLGAMTIFTGMGLGMASPYLLFAAFPSLVRYMPKPGPWMVIFKQTMGFVMMATVIWLVWVFMAQTSQLALIILLASLLGLSVAAWVFGEWATPVKPKKTRYLATTVAMTLLLFSGYQMLQAAQMAPTETAQLATSGDWQAYNPEKVKELRSEGKPVFVDFTAKWCLICQANKVVLHSSEISKAFKEHGVVTMTADWTKKDAEITKQLESLGRTGVPVYVLYPADGSKKPLILPQTLTNATVQEYLNKL
jgi:thiol:disulfide interchange protein